MKKILLLGIACIALTCGKVFATENVLQAIQITGVKDSYDVILKSDDVAEVKKTVQAPNKMIILLNGIRASKTINTIYNNTSSVDSVVVEPVTDESVKIFIQAANVQNARIQFDSLKTPLGVLNNSQTNEQKAASEILLSGPVTSFRPIVKDEEDDIDSYSLSSLISYVKGLFDEDKASWAMTIGLLLVLLSSIVKLKKMQSSAANRTLSLGGNLQQREIDMYRSRVREGLSQNMQETYNQNMQTSSYNEQSYVPKTRDISKSNYGLNTYKNSTKSPYMTPEVSRSRLNSKAFSTPVKAPSAAPNALQQAAQEIIKRNSAAKMQQQAASKTVSKPISGAKSARIDSMKFLEDITKIYENSGRADLAQGLKSNYQKAKAGLK
ncbi:MAG: hypothetical protein MJ229_07115 [bacterium]|nr:hypothetical protein [bacterium]